MQQILFFEKQSNAIIVSVVDNEFLMNHTKYCVMFQK